MTNWEEVKSNLKNNFDKPMALKLVQASKLPVFIKGAVMLQISNLSPEQIRAYQSLFIGALDYLQADDMDGLAEYLKTRGIPENFIPLVQQFAKVL